LAGIPGLLLGGWAADRAAVVRPSGRLLLAAASLLRSASLMYLALGMPSGNVIGQVALMGTGWMFAYAYYPSVYAAVQDVVQPALRGTAMALASSPCTCLGFGPVLVGS
jgi:hypothetical protein